MVRSLVGTRIRQRRRSLGLQQTELAARSGISPSYLNLIEHNRRNTTTRVLEAIAAQLELPVSDLSEGAELALESDLREAAALHSGIEAEADALDEFIGRFPGWASLLAGLSRSARDHSAALSAMAERMNYDPLLQNTLHEMLTNITAIRSSAGILVSEDDLPENMTSRFQQVIQDESRRLSTAAQELVSYFDRNIATPDGNVSPQEAFEMFLESHNHVFPKLEDAAAPADIVTGLVTGEPLLSAPEARLRARQRLLVYAEDARSMPLSEFHRAASDCGYSPVKLARHFDTDLHGVFRRLAVLPRPGLDAPNFGLVIINAAGQPLYRRPLSDFSLPRFSAICARWPLFHALTSIGEAISETIVLPDGREFYSLSSAQLLDEQEFGMRPTLASAMLVTELNQALKYGLIEQNALGPQRPVGTSCRLCPRHDCRARSEPNILLFDQS